MPVVDITIEFLGNNLVIIFKVFSLVNKFKLVEGFLLVIFKSIFSN